MRHFASAIAALFIALALAAPVAAADPAFPALTGRVVDQAGILPADAKTRIEGKLAAYEAKTSDQIVVATVASLGELTIEDYANRLFRSWGIGQKQKNNGVLLLVAPSDRKVRIETGYGAEGAITDAVASTIIATVMAPKFRQNDFPGGIEAGVDQIIAILSDDAAQAGRKGVARPQQADGGLSPFIPLVIFLIIFYFVFVRGQRGGARFHRTRNGGWIVLPPLSGGGGWSGGGGFSGGGGWSGGGGFSGGGGSSGGGGASGSW